MEHINEDSRLHDFNIFEDFNERVWPELPDDQILTIYHERDSYSTVYKYGDLLLHISMSLTECVVNFNYIQNISSLEYMCMFRGSSTEDEVNVKLRPILNRYEFFRFYEPYELNTLSNRKYMKLIWSQTLKPLNLRNAIQKS